MRLALVACPVGGCSFANVPSVPRGSGAARASTCKAGRGAPVADVAGGLVLGVGPAVTGYEIATGGITFGDPNRADVYEKIGAGIAIAGVVVAGIYAASAIHGFRHSGRCAALQRGAAAPPR